MECLQNHRNRNFCLPSLWRAISERFPDDRRCLACFLAYHSAEVLSGVKPGNLINISNRRHPCGKNLFTLWRRGGQSLLDDSDISAKVLAERKDSLLVYIYCPESLIGLLKERHIRKFLEKAGYGDLSSGDSALAELKRRMGLGGFPHEIGLFLGYPSKDVAGFMGWARLSVSCQVAWKIYGDPCKSLKLAVCHRECRRRMAERLRRDDEPSLLLGRNFCHFAADDSVLRQAI